MGAGTQTHLIFPRRAIPGVSWSPPLERAEIPQASPQATNELAAKLAKRKAVSETGSPVESKSLDAWTPASSPRSAASQGSPEAASSKDSGKRIDTQAMTGQPSSSGDAAAQVASLIRMFEQQKAKPPQVLDKSTSEASTQSRTVLESHPLEALDTAASETEDSAAPIGAATTDKKGGRRKVKLKWWQRLAPGLSKQSTGEAAEQNGQARPEDSTAGAPAKRSCSDTRRRSQAAEAAQPSNGTSERPGRRISGSRAAPNRKWYAACVSGQPGTPPEPGQPLGLAYGDRAGLPFGPIESIPVTGATDGGRAKPKAGNVAFEKVPKQTMPGGKSARGRLANGSTKGLGEGNPLAGNDSTLLDTWLLPRGPAADPAARDDVPGSPARPTAAARSPQTPRISPRTPLVAREGIANPTVRPSRFSSANEELLAAYPSSPEAPSPQQMLHTSAPNAVALATIVAQPAPPQSSAQTGREHEDSLATTSAGVPSASQDEASGQLPTTEGAIRAESSQRPLRRARRLTGDRASRKDPSNNAGTLMSEEPHERSAAPSPPPKCARRRGSGTFFGEQLSSEEAQAAGNHTARVDQPHEALTDEAAEQPNQAASTTTSTASTVRHLTRAGDAQQFTAHAPEREGCQAPADDAAGTAAQPSQTSIVAVQGADVNLISISAGKSTTPQVGLLPRPPRVKASVAWNSLKALNSGGLALPKLSTAALTTSMCVLASMEQSMEVSAWACGAVCNSVLSRVPIVGPLVTVGEPEKPSLPVRVMRRGIRMAYGTAGAVSGTGAGMLSAPQILFRRRPAS